MTIEVGGVRLTEAVIRDESVQAYGVEVGAASPFFDGHFPGNPLLPAAAILTLVAAAFRAAHPHLPLVGFDAVRFSAPVGPGCRARLTFREPSSGTGSVFELATDDEILASGRIRHGEPHE